MSGALAALIGSRICHDLISPIGAINNGLELLTMSGDAAGPEIGLIGESVGNASARIRFFRIAFGAAGDQMVGAGEVQSILRDLYEGSRLTVLWDIDDPVQRDEVRMALLSVLCFESAMPYGGRITVTRENQNWLLSGHADRINVVAPLWELLSGGSSEAEVKPSHVQFALLPLVAKDADRRITCRSDETTISLAF
ncbi:histidine phosphotransferase ChpT [Sulfitobacter noctilucae]|uniref:histidine phosphotransferase family protein n=1 Tax=Sulfitobacter noctilucae TaxID=1342302 RepID=UPI00055E2BB6|nr:histidine phosphotransferase family protein [Sulfitobacter noctilucae]KIN61149.1 histidine phosphotransferase ChpT [Sulfitobacter noctilucae]